ncbi:MAG: tetratricopeptide repeat protein [Bacteriovoracaceae bacterium]|nr:tetratricopeptide repeat protein [Bacteriovoracaceae bacterium]
MRLLMLLGTLMVPFSLYAQLESSSASSDVKFETELKRARDFFGEGKYGATRSSLNALGETLKGGKGNKTLIGLVAYWTGITANRQQEYSESIPMFEQALSVDYKPKDIYYEYGQALYAAEKLPEARNAFRESLKRGHKRAVCLYYIGFISQTLKDHKKAVTFYRAIQRLPKEEQDETIQASEMQIGDIYLEQAEKHPDAYRAIQTYVIPQYQRALEINSDSPLASDLRAKIIELQQKYELVLFRMRNGRPTSVPPYLMKLSEDIYLDTNPVFAAQETTNSSAKQSSLVSKTEAFGRYTFYHKNIMSISPEMKFNYTRHLKREAEIYRNDNWVLAPAIRSSYEHTWRKKPASFLVDYDYVYSNRDRNAAQELKFNSRVQTLSIGERIVGLISHGESTLRLRYRDFNSYSAQANSKTMGAAFEHIQPTQSGKMFIYNLGYDVTRVTNDAFDSNTLFMRADVILPAWKKWQITPQVGFGLTLTDPLNDTSRGLEKTYNPSLRLSKPMWKKYNLSFHADYMQNDSKNLESFAYKKSMYGFELAYLF